MHGAPGGQFPEGRWVGCGLGQSLAQLTSLVQNPTRGGRERVVVGQEPRSWVDSQAGTGAILQRWAVWRGGGAAERVPIPSHQ